MTQQQLKTLFWTPFLNSLITRILMMCILIKTLSCTPKIYANLLIISPWSWKQQLLHQVFPRQTLLRVPLHTYEHTESAVAYANGSRLLGPGCVHGLREALVVWLQSTSSDYTLHFQPLHWLSHAFIPAPQPPVLLQQSPSLSAHIQVNMLSCWRLVTPGTTALFTMQ